MLPVVFVLHFELHLNSTSCLSIAADCSSICDRRASRHKAQIGSNKFIEHDDEFTAVKCQSAERLWKVEGREVRVTDADDKSAAAV